MIKALTPSELRGKEIVYLVDLEFAGRTFYLSTKTVSITRDDGTSVLYRGDLNRIEFTDAVQVLGSDAPRRSLPIEARLRVDVPRLVARGHPLERASGMLTLWVTGRTWENRVPLLRGKLREAEYDDEEGTIVGTLVDEPETDGVLWPPGDAVVDDVTWPTADGINVGRPYPTVIGRPAVFVDTTGAVLTISGPTEGLLVKTSGVNANYLLIAGHEVYSSTVTPIDSDGNSLGSKTVLVNVDGRGRPVSVVVLTDAEANSPDFGLTFHVAWGTTGGGAYADGGGGSARKLLRGLGDVTCWCLRRSGLPVDWEVVEAQRERLNRFNVDAAIEERVALARWLKEGPIQGLPVWSSSGPNGMRVGAWFPEDAPVFHFRAPRDGHRVSIQHERGEVINARRVEFALERATDTHRQASLVTGLPWSGSAVETPSAYAETSRALYGEREGGQLSLDHTADRASVSDLQLLAMRQEGLGQIVCVYRAPPVWAWLPPGTPGSLTDPDVSLEAVACLCRGVTHADGAVELEFLIVVDLPGARASA